ncbi:MAG: hypothetical protein RL693_704 [Verrucomicrobiota bacterium]
MSSSTTALLSGSFEAPSVEELSQLLPQFEMQGFLAQGGMGAVYLARQLTLDRLVAIKVLPQAWGSAPKYAERFQYEARAMAKMHHNGIVGVYDFGMTAAGHLYLVMEYVEGETLHELIQTQSLTPKKSHSIALQLCDAVAYAHEHGILHRDIKPGNIIINSEGRVKVADFGLARPAEACIEIDALGTPGYAAPELLVEGAVIDHHADIYAIGVVCYEMLFGKLPNTSKRPLSGLATFDPAWDRAIDKSTRTKPESRFSTVRELRDTLAMIGKMARPKVMAPVTSHHHTKKEDSFPWLMTSVMVVLGSVACFWWIKNKGEVKVATGEITRKQQAKDAPTWNLNGTPEVPGSGTATAPLALTPLGAGATATPFEMKAVTPGHVFKLKEGHKNIINDIAIFPDQRHVASCSQDGTVMVWDLEKGERVRVFDPKAAFLYQIAISRDGQYIAAGGNENKVHVWSVDAKEPLSELNLTGRNVLDLAFSPDGSKVLAACSDNAQPLHVLDWQQKTSVVLEGWKQPVHSLKFVRGGAGDNFITAGYSNRKDALEVEIKASSLSQQSAVTTYPSLPFAPNRMVIADDGRTAAAISGNRVTIFDLESGARLAQTPAIDKKIHQCEFVSGGKLLLTASQGGKLHLWEASTGAEVWQSKEELTTQCTNVFAISKDETYVVSGGGAKLGETVEKDGDFALHVWQLPPNMADLRSSESEKILVHREMLTLETSDTELSSLVTSLCAEWDEKIVKSEAAVLADLETKYVNALRRELLSSSPSQKPAVMDEIDRVTSHQPPNTKSSNTKSPNLQRLIKIFSDQCAALPKRSEEARKQLIASNTGKLAALETQRKARNDTAGAERVVLFSEALRAVNGEMVRSKIQAQLQTSLQSFQAGLQSAQTAR